MNLLAALEPLADRFHQPPRKRVLLSCVEKFFAHIDQFHLRQRSLFNALRQLDKRVLAAIRVVPAFELGVAEPSTTQAPADCARTIATSRPL